MNSRAMQIEEQSYFRVESEVKKDAKGGYIKGKISLPEGAVGSNLKLALYDINGDPHPNLLFVTPYMRQGYGQNVQNKELGLSPESHYLSLIYKNGTYDLAHHNHLYLRPLIEKGESIVGPKFWKPETNEILLGPEGLRLTVLKPLRKGNDSKILDSEMRKARKIPEGRTINYAKVKLGLTISTQDWNFPMGRKKLLHSNVIEDVAEYGLEISDVSPPIICDNGQFQVKINFNRGKLIKSKISKMTLKFLRGYDEVLKSNQYKIITQKEVHFYVKSNPFLVLEHTINLNTRIEIMYQDNTYKKVEKKRCFKITKHSQRQNFCHCHEHKQNAQQFLQEITPKSKAGSQNKKRKILDNEKVSRPMDFQNFCERMNNEDDDLSDLDSIESLDMNSTVVEFYNDSEKEIFRFKKSLPTSIQVKVIGKKNSRITINQDGSLSVEDVIDEDDFDLFDMMDPNDERTPSRNPMWGPPSSSLTVAAIMPSYHSTRNTWRKRVPSNSSSSSDEKYSQKMSSDSDLDSNSDQNFDEKSSQKSNSTTERVTTKSTSFGDDTGRRLQLKISESENSDDNSDVEEYVFPDLRGGGISNTSSLKDIQDWQKMPKIQQGMMRIAGWHEKWLRDPNNEIEDLEIEKQGLEDENLELKEELKELEQKIEEYRLRTKNSLAREENLRYEKDALAEENNFLKNQKDDLEEEVNLLKNELEQTRQELQRKGPKQCKFFKQNKFCKFRSNCRYSHYK